MKIRLIQNKVCVLYSYIEHNMDKIVTILVNKIIHDKNCDPLVYESVIRNLEEKLTMYFTALGYRVADVYVDRSFIPVKKENYIVKNKFSVYLDIDMYRKNSTYKLNYKNEIICYL